MMDSLAQKFDDEGVAYERGKPIDPEQRGVWE